MHPAFENASARRGRAAGKYRILGDLNAKYALEASLKAWLAKAKLDYSIEKGVERA